MGGFRPFTFGLPWMDPFQGGISNQYPAGGEGSSPSSTAAATAPSVGKGGGCQKGGEDGRGGGGGSNLTGLVGALQGSEVSLFSFRPILVAFTS